MVAIGDQPRGNPFVQPPVVLTPRHGKTSLPNFAMATSSPILGGTGLPCVGGCRPGGFDETNSTLLIIPARGGVIVILVWDSIAIDDPTGLSFNLSIVAGLRTRLSHTCLVRHACPAPWVDHKIGIAGGHKGLSSVGVTIHAWQCDGRGFAMSVMMPHKTAGLSKKKKERNGKKKVPR